jgi:hypothetical protein
MAQDMGLMQLVSVTHNGGVHGSTMPGPEKEYGLASIERQNWRPSANLRLHSNMTSIK